MEVQEAAPVDNGAEAGVVDEAILSELFMVMGDDGAGGLAQACDLFLTSVPTRLAAAGAAVADGRFGDAGRLAHSIRGSAGVFGASGVSRLADRLERACGQSDAGLCRSLLEQMTPALAAFGAILQGRLASLPS